MIGQKVETFFKHIFFVQKKFSLTQNESKKKPFYRLSRLLSKQCDTLVPRTGCKSDFKPTKVEQLDFYYSNKYQR